jgi:adenylate kinase
MAAGELVSDDLVEQVIRRRPDEHDRNYSFIIDGLPAASHGSVLLESYDLDAVILLEVPDRVVE